MKLEQLLEGVPFTLVQGSLDTEVQDIIYDSRKAAPGLAFVCIVGTQRDSHEFAADCAAKGVSVLVIQHDIDLSAMPGVTVVKVESSRYAMALMSGNLFGNPSRQMTMIGVTGTKGKTTTTHMIKSVLEAAGKKVGMIGTNGIYFMGRHQETANTTPESYELQKTFRQFLDAGCNVALMEVSSQGLMMDRVAGVHYDIGVFTNLSPDHIGPGEHKTFEEYRSWKGQLFRRCDVGVVNIDDENTEALLEGHTCKLVTYGRSEKADYRAEGCELLRTHDFLGVAFHVSGRDNMDVRVNMPGEFSVYNALAALAVGVEGARIAKTLSFKVGEDPILIVAAGDAKVDNSKYKHFFGAKAKMLTAEEAVEHIGHAVGGVCPFALPDDVKTYLDVSLKRFETVFPAVGSAASAIELNCDELERCCGKNFVQWVDVCKGWQAEEA